MDIQNPVFEVAVESFQTDVVERSKQLPVVLLFWAEQVPPSVAAKAAMESAVAACAGKIWLGLVNVAQDQTLAQQLRVQDLPSLRVVQNGQIGTQLDGPQADNVYVELVNNLTVSSTDLLKGDLESCLETQDYPRALEFLKAAIEEEPDNHGFKVEYADVLILSGDSVSAGQIMKSLPEDTEDLIRPTTRLEIASEVVALPTVAALEQSLSEDKQNLNLRHQLALRHAYEGDYDQALDQAMAILLQDREFEDDLGRLTMIRIFSLMGKNSKIAKAYRRRMFNAMH